MAPTNLSPQLPAISNVLILDDQRFDRHRLARLCSGLEMKCTITNATDLADFAAVIESSVFNLVLVDYFLPDGTGFDALSMVRLSPRNCNAATIMVTGHEQDGLAHNAIKAGCSDYILKDDLSATSFRRAVTNALQKSILTTEAVTQSFLHAETEAVLNRFASKCAQDIKPMVSRMMRQIRDLRGGDTSGEADQDRFERVEDSCMVLWEFLVELERYNDNAPMDDVNSHSAQSLTTVRKPPSPFARLTG